MGESVKNKICLTESVSPYNIHVKYILSGDKRGSPMTLSFLNIVKKEDTETEPTSAQGAGSNENAEASQDEAQNKGKHGEDFCCGSCS